MAKKDKVVDLKPKADKVSDEQLSKLQNVVSNINKLQFDIGTIETQKHNLLHAFFIANDKIKELQDDFMKEYGTININIQDGTINYNDEQTNKKN